MLPSTVHFDPRRGTHEQALQYVTKQESRINGPWFYGEPVKQGTRTDLHEMYTAVKERKTNAEILEASEGAAAKFEKAIRFMRFTVGEQESDRQLQGVRVLCLYGPTGTGKTYAAINLIANRRDYYIAECPSSRGSKLWFDGYEGQKTLVLDDFSGDFCDFRFLLRLLDVYKLKVEVKGGFSWAVWTTVVITTNVHPSGWYKDVNVAPLRRRIHEIRYVEHPGTYRLMDWDEHYLDDDFQQFPVRAPDPSPVVVPATPRQAPPPPPRIVVVTLKMRRMKRR